MGVRRPGILLDSVSFKMPIYANTLQSALAACTDPRPLLPALHAPSPPLSRSARSASCGLRACPWGMPLRSLELGGWSFRVRRFIPATCPTALTVIIGCAPSGVSRARPPVRTVDKCRCPGQRTSGMTSRPQASAMNTWGLPSSLVVVSCLVLLRWPWDQRDSGFC